MLDIATQGKSLHIFARGVKLHPVQEDDVDTSVDTPPPECHSGPSASSAETTDYPTEAHPRPDCGLRELKRLKTHRQIADAATALVLEHGYDAVNIEDICAKAGISRRTFFNYFETKDQSILGNGMIKFDVDDEELFLSQTHSDPLMAMLRQIENKNRAALKQQMALENTVEFHHEMRERIQKILSKEPKLSAVVISSFATAMRRVRSAFERYFDAHPQSRRCTALPVSEEVTLSVGFIRECVFYSSLHIDIFTTETPLHDAAAAVTTFMRRMP